VYEEAVFFVSLLHKIVRENNRVGLSAVAGLAGRYEVLVVVAPASSARHKMIYLE
jgi:hypothetical protein